MQHEHKMETHNSSQLRIVLLGKNELDNGRVGNLILGRDAFQTEALEVSDENLSERVRGQVEGRPITLINTPDLFNPQLSHHQLSMAVKECVSLSDPGPHVFILVLQPDNFTEVDRNKVKAILNSFSDEAMNYTIVLTTVRSARHISASYTGEKEDPLGLIIKECKMRHHVFDKIYRFDQSQVLKLLEKIDRMIEENGGSYLTYEKAGEIPGGSLLPEGTRIMKRGRESDFHEREERKKKKKGGVEIDILERAQEIMKKVKHKLNLRGQYKNNEKLLNYIRGNILGLEKQTVKKTTVGVFGMTGDGKSSLINAILGEKFLLPSGTVSACTSVCIEVEANMTDTKYTAEIEFISKKEWEADLKYLLAVLSEEEDGEELEESDIVQTAKEKISALFGEEAVQRSFEELKNNDQFSRILEFFTSTKKSFSCHSASKLSDEIRCFIKHDDRNLGGCYWPLVKRVTVKVPDCGDILENITLVDIPGNGDYNKTRDQMWTKILRSCSIVWTVCDIDRAAAKKEAWEILNRSLTDMAQGGECATINFICTKTDNIDPDTYMRNEKLGDGDLEITNKDQDNSNQGQRQHACILHRNRVSKERVEKAFEKQIKLKKYFGKNFEVFTVSSQEYFKENSVLKQEDTGIPELQGFLRTLNMSHSRRVATQYLSRASGLLSLIHASNCNNTERDKSKLHDVLKKTLENQLKFLDDHFKKLRCELESSLTEGVEKAENQSVKIVQKNMNPPRGKDGRGFHRTLTSLCNNEGRFRSRNGETRDLNESLVAAMYDCINEKFHLFFPNEGKTGQSVREKIDEFSIISSRVIMEYRHSPVMSHILNFLRTEENKLKEDLQRNLLEEKKKLHASLTVFIKEKMTVCYKEAAEHTGIGAMKKKQDVLQNHVESEKHSMFKDAKKMMLDSLNELMEHIVRELAEKLQESMAHSLTEWNTISNIDVTEEIEEMKELSRMLDEDQT